MKFLLFIFLLSAPVHEYTGKIIRVIDGDTFVLQTEAGNLKIRLDGIDAPEKKQAFALKSKQFLERYLYKDVKVVSKSLDRYGRTLGVLYQNGINVNLTSIQEGFSWHFKKYSHDPILANAEINARKAKRGLWTEPSPIAPWVWRKIK